MAADQAELERLAAEDPMMQLAKETLEQLSQDPEVRRLERERAEALLFYEMELAASKREGRAEGRVEGKAELLLKLLGVRFGPPPAAIRARIDAAPPEQLDAWAERVLTAQTLDEVFA